MCKLRKKITRLRDRNLDRIEIRRENNDYDSVMNVTVPCLCLIRSGN